MGTFSVRVTVRHSVHAHQQLDLEGLVDSVVNVRYSEWLAYPLSGGFSYLMLLPAPILLALHKLERARLFRNKFVSLRVLAVLEKA